MSPSFYKRLVDACIEMHAGEVVTFDDDIFAELKRRRLIRKPWPGEERDGVDYIISGYGQRLAEKVLKSGIQP